MVIYDSIISRSTFLQKQKEIQSKVKPVSTSAKLDKNNNKKKGESRK